MFNNKLFSMNLWRKAPWRGTFQCEAPFRFQQLAGYRLPAVVPTARRQGAAAQPLSVSQPQR
jgi:hypothetical protein